MEKMQSLIKRISSSIGKVNISDKKLFIKYLENFYSQCYYKDFTNYSEQDFLQLALDSFESFYKKPASRFKINFHSASRIENDKEVKYTVLDIINDDMPFLVDSVVIQFEKYGIEITNIIHPIYSTKRSKDGVLQDLVKLGSGHHESVIQLHLENISSDEQLKLIKKQLEKILETVRIVVNDFHPMIEVAKRCRSQIDNAKNLSTSPDEVKNFIDWIINNSFIFLGCAEYDIVKKNNQYYLNEISKSKLGLFSSDYEDIKPNVVNCSSQEIADSIKNPYLIEILKSRYKSQIHRFSNAERIRVQKFDANGKVIGEYRFIGLFASSVYYQSASLIPIIRNKINYVINQSGYEKGSHNYKDLVSVLESYPRDELFQIEDKDLFRIALGIVGVSGRCVVRFFSRNDKFSRFVSCLIFIPKDNFNTVLTEKIHSVLSNIYRGEVTGSYAQISDSNLARLHLIIRTDHGIADIDDIKIENKLIEIIRSWNDNLKDEVNAEFKEDEARKILDVYNQAFSVSYTNRFSAKAAVNDIRNINRSLHSGDIICDLYKSSKVAEDVVELKIYSPEKELQLSEIMPILDSFGFNVVHENTYLLLLKNQKKIWIHYFNLNLGKAGDRLTQNIRTNFEETLNKIWKKQTQIGYLNRLVIDADFDYRQVFLLRTYLKYLYQAGFRYSQRYISDVLVNYRDIAKLIVTLFETKFDPSLTGKRQEKVDKISKELLEKLKEVSDITDDIVIRRFFNIIDATVRTNYFQKDAAGNFKEYISFKLDSSKVHDLPLPVPYAEIFVLSSKVEAIHLRGGKVARGGLRWSDRNEDFRTEVLGLMKAQMTKNAVIVPVGSKGGFVIIKEGNQTDNINALAIECYKTFLRGLLDITDNVINGKIVHPKDVVRYDEADPYLVVAADKGTATFSDIANGISAEYNFWLGDAFASGGSVGYDHKKMGITAKGAWISVRRHFREMGIDIQNQNFTCAGIGDLSGDVFGNGMLLSKHTLLVAAFNHKHIFLDPNPDAAKSFAERQRMFNLPRSSWTDYDHSLISKGGGVFERSAKSIKISPEVKKVLDIADDELTPNALISAILKAPVDLLWNGGIGTYVKSTDENHMDVGDRINDVLRVDGCELRCKVVGEGGNLGFTQKGRIEYALNGGRINTDAMDNSAGVDCSDHEVNIKIALIQAMKANKVTLKERNKILESMTDEVSDLVLQDNRLQTQAITVAHSKGYLALSDQAQFLDRLEKTGLLNRKIEFLPTLKEIGKRQADKKGMTRPELCVMLAYSKMDLYSHILNSNLVNDKYFLKDLFNYFPTALQKKFSSEIENHQLRNEIIATQLTNSIVNRAGINFVRQISQDNGFEIIDIVRNYIIVRESFRLEEIWAQIEALDGKVNYDAQVQMFLAVNKLLQRSVLWLLRNKQSKDITSSSDKFKAIIDELLRVLPAIMATDSKSAYDKNLNKYTEFGVGPDLARKIAAMDPLGSAYDIIEISNKSDFDIKTIGRIYFDVGTRLNIKWLRNKVNSISGDDYWQRLSTKTILEDLYNYQMKITKQVVDFSCRSKDSCPTELSLQKWIENTSFLVERYDGFINDLKSQINPDLPMMVVALNRIKALVS